MSKQVLPVLSLVALLSTGCAQKPSTTVESFLEAIRKGDRDTAVMCVTAESRPDSSEKVAAHPELRYRILSEVVEEGRAVVDVELSEESGEAITLPVVLLREEGLWKIDAASTGGEMFARQALRAGILLARFSEGFLRASPELRQAIEEVGTGLGRAFEEMGKGLEKGLESIGRGLDKIRAE